MKRILMTSAIVAAMGTGLASGAWAQTADGGMASGQVFAKDVSQQSVQGDVMASALIGKDLYIPKAKDGDNGTSASAKAGSDGSASATAKSGTSTSSAQAANGDAASANPKANLDDVGQVGDVILTKDGKVDAVLVDVGGFLGIGSHTVALKWDALQWKMPQNAKSTADSYLVVNATRDQLEKAPAFKKSWMQKTTAAAKSLAGNTADKTANAADNAADATTNMANNAADATKNAASSAATATSNAASTAADKTADAANSAKNSMSGSADTSMASNDTNGNAMAKAKADGFQTADASTISVKSLKGAKVYDSKGDDVGEVSKVMLDSSGKKVNGAVVDVGGFLGIGEKPVKLSMDQLHVMTKPDSDDMRIYVSQTEAQLKKMPTYKEKG